MRVDERCVCGGGGGGGWGGGGGGVTCGHARREGKSPQREGDERREESPHDVEPAVPLMNECNGGMALVGLHTT